MGGIVMGLGAMAGEILTMVAQRYLDKYRDEKNKEEYEQKIKAVQPKIAAAIDGKKSDVERLTSRGGAAYAKVVLIVTYALGLVFSLRTHKDLFNPFVEDEHTVFLKTIIPSRKATKQYLGEESDHED